MHSRSSTPSLLDNLHAQWLLVSYWPEGTEGKGMLTEACSLRDAHPEN